MALRGLADDAPIPVCVLLDHATELDDMRRAVDLGVDAVMADGSAHSTAANAAFVSAAIGVCRLNDVEVEAELGQLACAEDGRSRQRVAQMPDPSDVGAFVDQTRIHALAISIGNVHGRTPSEPTLDMDRLARIRAVCPVPLVLHGASALAAATVRHVIATVWSK